MKKITLLVVIALLLSACSSATLDGAGKESAVIGKAFEEAEAVGTGSSLDKEADTSGQILFRGFTMQEMFRMGENDIISAFGEPSEYTEGLIQYGGAYDSATWMFFSIPFSPEPYIDGFGGESELFTFNGQSLEQEFGALVDMLGNGYFIKDAGYGWTTYEWDIGDIAFIFYTSDDDIAYSIFVNKLDGDTPIDSDDYWGGDSWYDDSWYEMYENLDSDLYGRWRAEDGSLIEFSDNGVVLSANFRIWPELLFFHDWVNPYYVTWQTSNGAITFTSYFAEDLTYKITTGHKYDHNAKEYIDADKLVIAGYIEGVRIDSSESGGIAGTWGWQDAGGGGTHRILYPDGTGLWSVTSGSNYPITWSADDETFYLQYESTASYDYYVFGDVMEFFFSNGSKTFIKVSN